MSLNNVAVFNRFAYTAVTEIVAQQIELFNQVTNNAIILRPASNNVGDYTDATFWAEMANMVRRRDPYSNADVAAEEMQMLVDTMVKVAGGTPPRNIPPVMFDWIGKDPEEAGVVFGQQLAPAMMQDMLNVAVAALGAALANQPDNFLDVSGGVGDAAKFNPASIVLAKAKLGDRSNSIAAWVTHSKPMHDYWGNAIANASQLYTYGTINVMADPFGVPIIMSDVPGLVVSGEYLSLGLQSGAALVEQNTDFNLNVDVRNGGENIRRTVQGEWSYNIGLKGFTWDKGNGGNAPTNAALATGTNWDKTATSHKNLAGVALRTV